MYSFGSGVLLGTRTDIDNATPVNFGLVQEVTIDEQAGVKELYGQYQRPLAIARGTARFLHALGYCVVSELPLPSGRRRLAIR